ncbi:hypothetical protein ACIQXA_32390 [Streptomyces massasporeus]|uniref:hypothetical protein n=1 Tax=Streptomyces massasporeus TaxID=67324 RepID=UPI0037F859A5
MVLAVTGAIYGVGAVWWRLMTGEPWTEALWFALTLTMSALFGRWLADVIRGKAGRDHS